MEILVQGTNDSLYESVPSTMLANLAAAEKCVKITIPNSKPARYGIFNNPAFAGHFDAISFTQVLSSIKTSHKKNVNCWRLRLALDPQKGRYLTFVISI